MYQIAIVIFDEFTDIDFFLMRDILGRTTTDWTVKVLGTKPSHISSLGMTVATDGHVAQVADADVVLFSSGYKGVPAALADPEFMSALKLDPSRQLLGSICAGSFFFAKLGLLDNISATTHPDAKPALVAMGVEVEDCALVINGNIATAGGCLSSLYLTGWVAERLFDSAKRREIHRQLIPAGQADVFDALIESSITSAIR
ncbi:DJ-1/PfpI family protein [Shewanella xiamenensis]|uniref:DJ-1/PfpI family protein n=1 Tax=Shewanella xiamenensis TaxID=332186 RepID=UPI00166DC8B4|nr:DJ-1/PfpI family protein [Shewanella xiamenensis]MCL1069758.1 DJ-1/PfpI family protein [Shewanella xiamenensis]MCR4533523.1 DJ-1/PfpI family protein [Shewanella xiamenensis]WHF54196.1 DJ-1/PfpI family protein [Shewanella xiamenensis]GGM88133.1 thimanine synthesis protein ThiJ [Shewanella xiamenensis]